MTTFLHPGGARYAWEGERDQEGHRTFKLRSYVWATSKQDGPAKVILTPGLPTVGSPWNFGNDNDFWAFCYPTIKVTPVTKKGPNFYWSVEQTFGTKPLNRCQDTSVEDPLLEPDRLSGSFVTEQKQATTDRNGNLIQNSSGETVFGPLNEWDNALPTVRVEQNVAALGLSLFTSLMNTVNDNVLWGMPARTIKLSGASWEEKFWGLCNKYYTRIFNFDVNADTFDRSDIVDEGTKFIDGDWDNADPPEYQVNPFATSYIRATDPRGNPIHSLLDSGTPLNILAAPQTIPLGTVEKYDESNLLLLGIPTTLG